MYTPHGVRGPIIKNIVKNIFCSGPIDLFLQTFRIMVVTFFAPPPPLPLVPKKGGGVPKMVSLCPGY